MVNEYDFKYGKFRQVQRENERIMMYVKLQLKVKALAHSMLLH